MAAEPFMSMKLQGANELALLLESMPEAASSRAQLKILRLAAEPMRVEMSRLAPRGEGSHGVHLADSIEISTIGSRSRDRQQGEATIAVGPTIEAFWGLFQEFGTIRQAPRPFAGPAFDNQTKQAFKILQEGYWTLLMKWLSTRRPRGKR